MVSFRRWALPILIVLVGFAAMTYAAVRVIDDLVAERDAELQRTVDRAARHAAARHRVMQLELQQVAQRFARSELVAWLGMVQDYALSDSGPFVVDFAKRVAPFRPKATRSALQAEGQAFLAGCGDARKCIARALAGAGERAREDEAAGVRPERVAVYDAEGRAFDGGPSVRVVDEAVRSRSIVRDFDRWPGSDVFHALAAAPILEGQTLRGVVLVGRPIGARLEREAAEVGASLTWVVSGTIGVAATTLGDEVGQLETDTFITGREVVAGNVRTTPTVIAAVARDDRTDGQLVWVALGIALLTSVALVLISNRSPPSVPSP